MVIVRVPFLQDIHRFPANLPSFSPAVEIYPAKDWLSDYAIQRYPAHDSDIHSQ